MCRQVRRLRAAETSWRRDTFKPSISRDLRATAGMGKTRALSISLSVSRVCASVAYLPVGMYDVARGQRRVRERLYAQFTSAC